MNGYLKASGIAKKPVVTLSGEAVAQVKDIVFDASRGSIRCFTLSGRGLLAGPLHQVLRWKNTHALGPDAVMVRNENALEDQEAARTGDEGQDGGDILGSRMMTRSGTHLGSITDAVIATGKTPVVAGYEIETAEHRRVLVPVTEPVTVSGDLVIVPDATAEHTAGDLAGLHNATEALREQIRRAKQED
ncbi:PRC-barrel domain-containing protein [Streptomyces sp. NPDC048389]|uniref:PRC-barrel domain-containing protein n=1 Tax=Streptomyces sp. NPDC048389 TaxID=3154622 RepID=UPI0034516BC2